MAQAGDFLHFPLPAPGVQPGLITSHPPRFAPRVPGGSPRLGEGWILINPRPEIPPEGPGRAAGVRGPPAQNLAIRPHPLPLSPPPLPTPHHGNWASSRPPRSAPHSCLWGRAGHDDRSAPSSCFGTSTAPPTPTTPDWAHLLRGLGSGAGPATPRSIPSALRNGLPFINSPLHTHTLVVITLRWALAGRSRAEPGLRAPSSLPEFRPSASCLSDTIVPILQVKAVRFGQRKGWWSRSSGRLAGQLPGPR